MLLLKSGIKSSPSTTSPGLRARFPGCSLGVIRDGHFVYRKAYGSANLELDVPLSPESVFYMDSVSKQFTVAAGVLAAEQGLLSLDDDVRKYVPELPDYGHVITLRQMLHNIACSGFSRRANRTFSLLVIPTLCHIQSVKRSRRLVSG
jgi:CubicO group peptidase (beta-lactamase class C family)